MAYNVCRATHGSGSAEGEVGTAGPGTWIFPIDEPLPPGQGDNQALSVNTTDDTATYSVAFALVWAEGEEVTDNANEAYALASCENCAAVAVAFQVVLVVGETDVAVPTNVSVAVNYDCTSCLTFSLAVQLFVTLDGPLSDAAVADIEELWAEVLEFGANIGQVPLDQIQAQLAGFEQQIIAIIEADQGPLTEPDTSSSPSPAESSGATPSPSGSVTPIVTPSDSTGPSPSESGSVSSSASPSADPSSAPTSTTPTATASSSPSASPSGSTSASP